MTTTKVAEGAQTDETGTATTGGSTRTVAGLNARVVIVAVAVVVAAVVGVLALLNGSSGNAKTARKPGATSPAAKIGVFDSFHRDDSARALGTADSGATWRSVTGTWGIDGRQAYVAKPAKVTSLAVAPMGGVDGFVQVKMIVVKPGAGIVVRYSGPRNFLKLVAVPKFSTWNLQQVLDGKATTIGNTGMSSVRDGTVVAIRLDAGRAEVTINGLRRAFAVPEIKGGVSVGMIASGAASNGARWQDFVASPAGTEKPLAPKATTTAPKK